MNAKPSVCYAYGRHSTNKQELSREVQEHRTKEYWERNLKPRGVAWGGFYYDPATSAKVPFTERPSGRIVHLVAQPGDHIVVTKLDRPFRSLRDGVVAMEQWEARGVFFHSLDLQVDTTTPIGKFFRTVLLAVAELEREFARERTRETVELRQKQGVPYSRGCPVGWQIVGEAPYRKYKVDDHERALVDEMQRMRDRGYGTDDIALWTRRQSLFKAKRSFPCRGQVRGALNARKLGYPKINDYKLVNKMAKGRA